MGEGVDRVMEENEKKAPLALKNQGVYDQLKERYNLEPKTAGIITCLTAILLTLTGVWQLIVVAGLLGGLFTKRAKKGVQIGFLGVFSAWLILFILYSVSLRTVYFFDYWLLEIMGLPVNFSFLFMVIASLIGGCFGGLGGLNGVYINHLVLERLSQSEKIQQKYL